MHVSKKVIKLALKAYFYCIPHERLVSLLLKIYSYGEDISASGEHEALKYIQKKLCREYLDAEYILFDVGANIGKYSIELDKHFGKQKHKIHAFEPLMSTFLLLKDNTNGRANIDVHHFGLSNEKAKMTVYTNKECSGLTSVYQRRLDHFDIDMNIKEECVFMTIDEFCEDNSIRHIHFLKLDVEGHEFSVLKGANRMLGEGRIDYIQFEFGGCNIDSRTFFQDFWYMLYEKYNIYKILPSGLYTIKRYTETREVFICSNYLAELKTAVQREK